MICMSSFAKGIKNNPESEEDDGAISDVNDPKSIELADAMFRNTISMANNSANILSCQLRVRYRVMGSRGNGFGAICLVDLNGRQSNMLVCNENMVGAPTIKLGGFAITRNDVRKFVRANCEPG